MKYLTIIFSVILVFSLQIISQSLDQSFLESLPDDVKEDLLLRNQQQASLEETQYRRPSTFIEKPNPDSDRFGLRYFSMMQTTLMPLNEPNTDDSYLLDFGDVIELQMIGQKSASYSLPLKRDGSVNIPEVGKLFLSGLSLLEASKLIKSKILDLFIGVDSFVTLTNIRDIQVVVTGNVFNPGPYTLNGNSNLFHALMVSGGPSNQGSFRNIKLIRNNETIRIFDLYEIFIFGNSSFGDRLRTGDIIFVEPASKIIQIDGAVKRPGTFEINENEDFDDLIRFANGIDIYADTSSIRLERMIDGIVQLSGFSSVQQLNEVSPNDGDSIYLRIYPQKKISIQGAVKNPGDYLINDGDRLLDVIIKAGGYTENAYPFGGILDNVNAARANEIAREKLYKNLLSTLSDQSRSVDAGMMDALLDEINSMPVTGRIVAEFDINKLESNPKKNIIIQDGDKILIPEITDQVYIFGEVSSQGASPFSNGEGIDFYIESSGGLLPTADKTSIFVLNPNGLSFKVSKNRFANKYKKIDIYPGSIIFVPKKINTSIINTDIAIAYANILGSLGLSVASLASIKD